jgi:hypothetical protein
MNFEEFKEAVIKEAKRIEENCEYSSKGHYNTSDNWSKHNLTLGIPVAICAALTALIPEITIKNILAIITAILAALQTVLKPNEKSQTHKIAAAKYLELKNKTRRFREFDLQRLEVNELGEQIKIYGDMLDEYNSEYPSPSRKGYELAQSDINKGFAEYRVDKEDK